MTLGEVLQLEVHEIPSPSGVCIAGRLPDGNLVISTTSSALKEGYKKGLYILRPDTGAIQEFYLRAGWEVVRAAVRSNGWVVWIEADSAFLLDGWAIRAKNASTGEESEVARSNVDQVTRATPTAHITLLKGRGDVVAWASFAPDSSGAVGSTLNLFDFQTCQHQVLEFLRNDGYVCFGDMDAQDNLVAFQAGRPAAKAVDGTITLMDLENNVKTELDHGTRRTEVVLELPWVIWTAGEGTVKARNLDSGRELVASGMSRWDVSAGEGLVTWAENLGQPVRILFLHDGREVKMPWTATAGGRIVNGLLCWWELDASGRVVTKYIDLRAAN